MCIYVSVDQFIPALLSFVVLSLVLSVPGLDIHRKGSLRSDLFCVEWDVKP